MKERHYTFGELGRELADRWGLNQAENLHDVVRSLTLQEDQKVLAVVMVQEAQKTNALLRQMLREQRRGSDNWRFRCMREGTKTLLEDAGYGDPADIRQATDSVLLKITGIGEFYLAQIREKFPYEGD